MYKLLVVIILFVLLSSSQEVFAASKDGVKLSKSAKNYLRLSNDLYAKGKYNEAIDYYKLVLEEDATNTHCMYNIAEAYRKGRYYSDAKKFYYQVVSNGGTSEYPMIRYWLGRMLKATEEYENAKESFQLFLNSYQGEADIYLERAKEEIEACDKAVEIKNNPIEVEIDNAGEMINTSKSDFAPVYDGSKRLYFSGSHFVDGKDGIRVKGNGTGAYDSIPVLRIYTSFMQFGNWDERELVEIPFSSDFPDFWLATPSFTKDGQYMFMTVVEGGNVSIYRSSNDGMKWSRPKKLENGINVDGGMSKHPFIFEDAQGAEYLLFSSWRDGGYGQYDLYIAPLIDGRPEEPTNLGEVVNTKWNDESPFYNTVTKTFYFSSDGHPGLGELDVFSVYGDPVTQTFKTVENVGYPINTGTDDKFFVQYDSTENNTSLGFISSNRAGGLAYKSGTCCDDIYFFKMKTPERIQFLVVEEILYEGRDKRKVVANARIKIIDPKTGEVLANVVTGSDGSYKIEGLQKEPGRLVNFLLRKKGYIPKEVQWDLGIDLKEADLDLYLERIDLPIVFYEFNRSNLIQIEKEKLDKVVYYLKQMEGSTLEIVSHTDSKGSNTYNMRLSERRCQFVLEYLVSKGIDIKRLKGKWFGEEKPLVSNKSKLGRDHNRRSQFGMLLEEEMWAESGTSHLDFNMFDEDGDLIASSEEDHTNEAPIKASPNENAKAAEDLNSNSSETITGGLTFKVQVGAFSDPGLQRFEFLSVASQVKVEQLNKVLFRFVVGEFSKLKDAEEFRLKMVSEGIKDAWIVPYKDGSRISMVAAKKLVDGNN